MEGLCGTYSSANEKRETHTVEVGLHSLEERCMDREGSGGVDPVPKNRTSHGLSRIEYRS